MSQPPHHLKPDFDPYKLKVAELRGILLQHDIPFPSIAKKTDLVKLFDSKLKPQAATLLQQYTSIRPSSQGILDGESQDGSLKELDTDSEQERQFEEEQKEKARVKKKGSRKSLVEGTGKGRRSVAGGKGKEKEVDGDGVGEGEEEREKERKARKARRQSLKELLAQAEGKQSGREEEEDELASRSAASGVDQEEEEEEEGEIGVSSKKRKASDGPGTPRLSVLSRTSAGSTLDSPATEAGNFSDYNPFQSGGEETPGRENKRRKSSLLSSSRLSSRKSLSSLTSTTAATSSSSSLTPHPAKERRSMPTSASTSSLSIAGTAAGGRPPSHTSQKKARVPPPVPVVPAAYSSAGSAVGAGSGSGGTSSTRTMSTSSFFAPPTPPLAASSTSTASSASSTGFFAPAPAREAAGSRASGWGPGSGSGSGSGIGRKRSRLEEVDIEVEEGEVDEGGEVEEEEEQEEEGEGEDEGMQLDDDDDEGGGRAGENESAAHQEEDDSSMDQDQDDFEPASTQAHAIPSPPFRPSSRTSLTASASAGGGGRATPVAVGKKYMVPVSQHKTTPPEVASLLADHRASGGSSGGGEVGSPARQGGSGAQLVGTPAEEREWEKEKEYRQVTVRTEERKGRRSDPSGSPSLSKLLGSVPAAQEGPTPRRSLPATLSRPPAARAAPAPPLPASPAALVPNKSTQKKKRLSQTASAITLSPPPFSSTSTSSYTDPFLPSGLSSLLTPLILSLLLSYILWARAEKLSLGFCDTNSPSNRNLAVREFDGQTSLAAPFLPNLSPSILGVLDATGLRPACTTCPSHGACSRGVFEGCELDYVPRSSFLSSISFGLIPTSPTCEADTEKQVAVAKAAAAAGRVLRKRRGEVVCGSWKVERQRRREARDKFGLQGEEEESFVYGVEAEKVLAALVREDEASPAPFPPEILDEINRLALRDLEMHGEVVKWINDAKKHKLSLSSVAFLLGMVAWGRRKWRKRGEEKELVRGLVERAVRQLQQQERSHHLHPTLTPYAHLAPSHLRDLLLPPTSLPSLTTRTRLWNQVSKLIEGNSNVRVGEVEVGGEVMRGWRWTGPTGVGSGLEIEGGKVKEEQGQEQEQEGSRAREMVQVGGGRGGVASPFATPVSLK